MFDDPLMAATSGAFFRLLEALAQFAMQVGLGVGDVHALTEKAFVAAARTVLSESGEADPENTTRIAARTGLYRCTVNDLLSMEALQAVRNKPFQNPSVRVMREWRLNPDYCETGGVPKILPIRGEPPSFQALIKSSIGDDLSPKTILRDLQRVAAVKKVGSSHVQLIRNTYGDASWEPAQITQMGEELRDHLRVMLQILQQRAPEPLHRYIVHEGLPVESAAILEREISGGATVLFNAHQRAVAHEADATRGLPGQKHRLSASIVILREPVVEETGPKRQPRNRQSSAKRVRTRRQPRKKGR